jgi:hypothetical protein
VIAVSDVSNRKPSEHHILLGCIVAVVLCGLVCVILDLVWKQKRIDRIKGDLFGFGESVSLTSSSPTRSEFQQRLTEVKGKLPIGSAFYISPNFTTHPNSWQAEAYIDDKEMTGFFVLYYTPDYSCRVKYYDSRQFESHKADMKDFARFEPTK